MTEANLLELLPQCRVLELSHPLEKGIPISPNQPGFQMALQRRHGDQIRADGLSGANEIIVMGGHTGTHLDALCHVAHEGVLHGGVSAAAAQVGGRFSAHGIESIGAIVARGVLLDIPSLSGRSNLEGGEGVSAKQLDEAERCAGVEVSIGDAVLIRTGWTCHWHTPTVFSGEQEGAPGVDVSGADWLASRKIRIAGTDTMAFEQILKDRGHSALPVHRALLVEAGINILEMVALDELAQAGVSEFLFVLTPLKVVGATGVPVNPIAILV
jgi:kynurenine formamidase